MQSPFRLTTALLFLGSTALMLASWTGLMITFDYPQILRESPAHVLKAFFAGGDFLRLLWTGMSASSVLLLFSILALHNLLKSHDNPFLAIGTAFGVLSALVQVVGLIRWVLVVPVIAVGWQDDQAARPVWEALFTVINAYGGVAIGETLGYVFTAVWIAFVGAAILKTAIFPKVTGWLALATGAGLLVGVLENVGWGWAVGVNATAYLVLLGLFVTFGVTLLRPSR